MTQLERLGIRWDVQAGWEWRVRSRVPGRDGHWMHIDEAMKQFLVECDNDDQAQRSQLEFDFNAHTAPRHRPSTTAED